MHGICALFEFWPLIVVVGTVACNELVGVGGDDMVLGQRGDVGADRVRADDVERNRLLHGQRGRRPVHDGTVSLRSSRQCQLTVTGSPAPLMTMNSCEL